MAAGPITRDEVISRIGELPAFPRIVSEILSAIDDPDSSLELITGYIKHDPVITGRILSMANSAAVQTRRLSVVRDVFTATSLIGISRVRETVIACAAAGFVSSSMSPRGAAALWQHSVAVAVCCEELANHLALKRQGDTMLVMGLLHDIGQMWLSRFRGTAYREAWRDALSHAHGIDRIEREQFGADHAEIGTWLLEHWKLPATLVAGVRHHHDAGNDCAEITAPLLHVAEVLSNALDLGGRPENRVTSLSSTACSRLGLAWDGKMRSLFGRIDARSAHANQAFALRDP